MWFLLLSYLWQTLYTAGSSIWMQVPAYLVTILGLCKFFDCMQYTSTVIVQDKFTQEEAKHLMEMIDYASDCYKSEFQVGNAIFCQSKETDSEAYIWNTNEELYISFRGTEDPKDLVYDLDVRTIDIDPGVYVHNGFYTQFMSIEPQLTHYLNKYIKAGGNRVILVGHSLGGALASVAAYHYHKVYHTLDLWTYTFGSPRVGNITFAQNDCHKQGCRVYTYQDPVSMIPMSYRFEHVHTPALCLHSSLPEYTQPDLPWYLRLFTLLRLDWKHPLRSHYSATYSDIIHKVAGY